MFSGVTVHRGSNMLTVRYFNVHLLSLSASVLTCSVQLVSATPTNQCCQFPRSSPSFYKHAYSAVTVCRRSNVLNAATVRCSNMLSAATGFLCYLCASDMSGNFTFSRSGNFEILLRKKKLIADKLLYFN